MCGVHHFAASLFRIFVELLTPSFASGGKVTKKWVHGKGEKNGISVCFTPRLLCNYRLEMFFSRKKMFFPLKELADTFHPEGGGITPRCHIAQYRLNLFQLSFFQVIQGK